MPYQKIQFKPGVYKDDSPLEAAGYWIDADKIRFVRGMPETIYGWERATTTQLLGISRGAFTWADNGRNPFAAFGTNLRLYAMDVNGIVTDITPIIGRSQGASISFTTQITSAIVTATYTAHGLVQDQKFTLDSANTATVGGVTINGTYVVLSVVDANNITYTAAQVATSNAGPTAVTVNVSVYLAPGQIDGLGGLGFGTGAYGSGGYGGAASGYTLYPRTWSFDKWGQNLIANPRGGAIYEWAPNVTAAELTTNGTFTGSAAGWTAGAGWAYSSNSVAATASSAALSQSVTTLPGAWHIISVDMSSWSTGALTVSYNGVTAISAAAANGTYRGTVYSGAGGANTLALTGTNLTAVIDNVSMQVETTAQQILGAPNPVTCTFVSAERILVACGCPTDKPGSPAGTYDGSFDAMRIGWTDTQNNETWLQLGTNLAGAYTLTNGSRIVRGVASSAQNFILTDTALYGMRFNTDPTIVYQFPEIGSACGLIGPNAVTQVGGVLFWLDPVGGFWMYDGSYPTPLRCTLGRDVHDNISFVQQDKIYAFPVTTAGRTEVWWIYPDIRDGNECSRYVIYSVSESQDQGFPVWSCGTFNRSAWANGGIFQYPLAVDTSGNIWFQEKGFTQDGGPRSWSATTAFFDLAPDGSQMRIKNVQPDTEDLQGGYTLTYNTKIRNGAGIYLRSFGPYNVNAMTGKNNIRANGEESQIVFSGNSAPAFFRLGAYRHEIESMGRYR